MRIDSGTSAYDAVEKITKLMNDLVPTVQQTAQSIAQFAKAFQQQPKFLGEQVMPTQRLSPEQTRRRIEELARPNQAQPPRIMSWDSPQTWLEFNQT